VSRAALAAAAIAVAFGLGGCVAQPKTLYGWGSYEDVVYAGTVKTSPVAPEVQIQQMEKDRELIRNANRRLPPGWHGHLAYLYSQVGQAGLAHDELVAEKTAFPEATVFCDTLLANMGAKVEKAAETPAEKTP
jgi:hypothetical protein